MTSAASRFATHRTASSIIMVTWRQRYRRSLRTPIIFIGTCASSLNSTGREETLASFAIAKTAAFGPTCPDGRASTDWMRLTMEVS